MDSEPTPSEYRSKSEQRRIEAQLQPPSDLIEAMFEGQGRGILDNLPPEAQAFVDAVLSHARDIKVRPNTEAMARTLRDTFDVQVSGRAVRHRWSDDFRKWGCS